MCSHCRVNRWYRYIAGANSFHEHMREHMRTKEV